MFTCGICKGSSLPGDPASRVVLERRSKVYAKENGETVTGWEIVKEALAHGGCALTFEGKARVEEEAARKAKAGQATIGDVLPGTFVTQEDLAVLSGERDEQLRPAAAVLDEQGIDIVPVPLAKLEEAFPKPPKKPRRRKKVDEETN